MAQVREVNNFDSWKGEGEHLCLGCVWFESRGETEWVQLHLGLILVFGRQEEPEATHSPEVNIRQRSGIGPCPRIGGIC